MILTPNFLQRGQASARRLSEPIVPIGTLLADAQLAIDEGDLSLLVGHSVNRDTLGMNVLQNGIFYFRAIQPQFGFAQVDIVVPDNSIATPSHLYLCE
jgi:hypothetical protein